MPYCAPRLAAFVTDLANIQLMKMLSVSIHVDALRPSLSSPRKKLPIVKARGESAHMTIP